MGRATPRGAGAVRRHARSPGPPDSSTDQGVVRVLSAVVVLLACSLVYLNHEDLFAAMTPASEPEGPRSDAGNVNEPGDVDRLCEIHRERANDHFRAGRMQPGLDELMSCAEKTPTNARHHWDVGVVLSRLKDHDNAISWMAQASKLDPHSSKFRRGAGLVATRARKWATAITHYEAALEILLRLQPGTWEATMLSSVSEDANDLAWIADESSEAVDLLQNLLQHYLRLQHHVKVNAAFKIVTLLRPEAHIVHQKYADFLAANGLIFDATRVLMADLRVRITEKYAVTADSYGFANLHGLLYLAGGLDAHTVSIGRQLLLAPTEAHLTTIRSNCALAEAKHEHLQVSSGVQQVSAALLRGLLAQCIDEQGIVNALLDAKASVDVKNGFGFSLLHYAASFGDPTFLGAAVGAQPMMDATTSLGHTPAHIAVIRGNVNLLPQLLLAGVDKSATDRRGRTVLDVACLHRYLASNVIKLFGTTVESACPKDTERPKWVPAPSPESQVGAAGWKTASQTNSNAHLPTKCDFDVLESAELSTSDFIFDYLALQRPVLIRRSAAGPRWQGILTQWSRSMLDRTFGNEQLRVSAVPYAEGFELNATTTTISLSEYLKYMDRLHKKGVDPRRAPDYAFESLTPDSPLTKHMQLPTQLDPGETEIIPQNVQFYVGPAGSGAPMHFHRAAYNVLLGGRKRWVLAPPRNAVYSKQSAAKFFRSGLSTMRASGAPVLECIQEAGDTLFVPSAWGHATLNLAESVGYASEFIWGADEFSVSEELLDAEELGPAADEGAAAEGLSAADEKVGYSKA